MSGRSVVNQPVRANLRLNVALRAVRQVLRRNRSLWRICLAPPRSRQILRHRSNVAERFSVRRNTVVLVDRGLSGVIRGDGFRVIVVVIVEQKTQIADTTLDIVRRVESIADTEAPRSSRDQLHDALRAFGGYRAGVVIALGKNNRVD